MPYSAVFTPEAEEQLVELYRYIAIDASPAVAEKFTSAIVEFGAVIGVFSGGRDFESLLGGVHE